MLAFLPALTTCFIKFDRKSVKDVCQWPTEMCRDFLPVALLIFVPQTLSPRCPYNRSLFTNLWIQRRQRLTQHHRCESFCSFGIVFIVTKSKWFSAEDRVKVEVVGVPDDGIIRADGDAPVTLKCLAYGELMMLFIVSLPKWSSTSRNSLVDVF